MAVVELLHHGVELIVAGHVHAYERTHPVLADGSVDASCGMHHVIVGDGGNREGLYNGWSDPAPAWSASREASYGFATLTVHNRTHALYEWHRGKDAADAPAGDSAWVVSRGARGASCAFR